MYVFLTGGTVDITVHEVIENGKVKEIVAAYGEAAGGINVDEAFKKTLSSLWGNDFIEIIKRDSCLEWLKIQHSFELVKRKADPSSRNNMAIFSVTTVLAKKFQEACGSDILHDTKNSKRLGVVFDSNAGCVELTAVTLNSMFEKTVNRIIKCVAELNVDMDYIFMVGGFSSSKYLQSAIKSEFDKKAKVRIPEDPGLAVLRGAVMFESRPDCITERIARKSYGIGGKTLFDEAKHKEDNRVTVEKVAYCNNIFDSFLQKNSCVKLDSSVIRTYHPAKERQTTLNFRIYASDLENPMYTDDKDTREIGKLTVSSPDTSKGRDRPFAVAFYFGGTEIKVTVKEQDVPGAVEENNQDNIPCKLVL